MNYMLHHGCCLAILRTLADNSIDAVVTDPPYGLSFMGKRWDYDVPNVEVWAECLRVLRPGGYLLAFAGTRTQHRMAVRIEDAGFEIRDMIAWVYGSGFPKSHNGEWGGTALKPALEPITMARKPLIGTVAENVLAHGTGGLNIDGCRVAAEEGGRPLREVAALRDDVQYNGNALAGRVDGSLASSRAAGSTELGRWPGNLIHDGSEEVLAAFPQAPGQSGAVTGKEPSSKTRNTFGLYNERPEAKPRGDTGSAARFFYCAKASRADRNSGLPDPGPQFAHGSTLRDAENMTDRKGNHHPTVKPTDLMAYLCRLVTPPHGVVLDPFMGSGSTGKAAMREGFNFIGIEREAEYIAIARARIEHELRKPMQRVLDLEAA